MKQDYSIKNLFNNLTTKQIIIFGASIIVVILLLVLSIMLSGDSGSTEDGGFGNENSSEVATGEETYTDEQGYTVTKVTTTDENGDIVVVETKMDNYGNVTTVEPSLITTYFPYQIMREHEGMESTLRYFLSINDEEKTIDALIEYCDEEGDKALVQEYINSIPIDLSSYTVNYESFSEDAICSVD